MFLAAINVVKEFTLSLQDSFIQEHHLEMKAYMDDVFVMSSSTKGTQLLLNRCTKVLTWAGMSFRGEKSRCIVIDGGVVKNVTPFTVNLLNSEKSQVIPTILKLEQFTSVYIGKWLNTHHSTTNICLYSSTSPCPLPIKSLTSVLKAAEVG